jgi:hypothetical protein
MAVAVPQAVDPSYLLQQSQWGPQGWSVVRRSVVRQLPVDAGGQPLVRTQLDAFEWTDFNAFGIGQTDDGIQKLRAEIQRRGSDLWAYALLRRQVFNALGVRIWSYRLLILHSIVELIGWAVFILAAAFAAIIFIQYVTMGRAPAVQDLQNFWSGLLQSAGSAVGQAGSGLSTPFIWVTVAAGAGAIFFALAGKEAGVKTRAPSIGATAGIKSKHLSGGISSR